MKSNEQEEKNDFMFLMNHKQQRKILCLSSLKCLYVTWIVNGLQI